MLILSSLAHSGGFLAILGHSGLLHAHSEPLWLILGILGHSEAFSTPHANSVLPMLILAIPGSFWEILGHSRQFRASHAYSGPPWLILDILGYSVLPMLILDIPSSFLGFPSSF